MKAYIDTIALFPETDTVDTTFTTEDCLVDAFKGYSVSFVLTNATADLSMEVELEASACSNGNFATVTGTKQHLAGNDTIIYNCSEVYYKYFRVKCTFTTGSCTLLIEVTRKN